MVWFQITLFFLIHCLHSHLHAIFHREQHWPWWCSIYCRHTQDQSNYHQVRIIWYDNFYSSSSLLLHKECNILQLTFIHPIYWLTFALHHFTDCNIGPAGIQSLAEALKINQSIAFLDVAGMIPNHSILLLNSSVPLSKIIT